MIMTPAKYNDQIWKLHLYSKRRLRVKRVTSWCKFTVVKDVVVGSTVDCR